MERTEHAQKHTAYQCHPLWTNKIPSYLKWGGQVERAFLTVKESEAVSPVDRLDVLMFAEQMMEEGNTDSC